MRELPPLRRTVVRVFPQDAAKPVASRKRGRPADGGANDEDEEPEWEEDHKTEFERAGVSKTDAAIEWIRKRLGGGVGAERRAAAADGETRPRELRLAFGVLLRDAAGASPRVAARALLLLLLLLLLLQIGVVRVCV